ncbi:MAG: A/G-specific adenine glycosylase [Chitinophagaceae bacterium]
MKAPFTTKLLKWNRDANFRLMPWKGEKNAYRIWLSEIILQQTRVEQGLAYYNRFIEAFPDIDALAAAPEEKVFKLWEGLGYYSRCKNLIATARYISFELNGSFPDSYENIAALKGIGPYTAAAIASFAFGLPHAVVDGNVLRVISRYFGISTPVQTSQGRKLFNLLAESLLDKKNPAAYNQSLMDFGATICKPRQPLCQTCIQQEDCEAFKQNFVNDLPVKGKKIEKKKRWLYYLLLKSGDHVFLRKRKGGDIWENLFEFYLHECPAPLQEEEINKVIIETAKSLGQKYLFISDISEPFLQQLTHQTISAQFISVTMANPYLPVEGFERVSEEEINRYAFPKIITRFLACPHKERLS